ncbi:hypothetical protein [Streptomyces phage phiScoe10]|nr:hypothetical protein [Streptomyces phage phiScoe10]
MASTGFAYVYANVGLGAPAPVVGTASVFTNVGLEQSYKSIGVASVYMNVGLERTYKATAFAPISVNVIGSTGITRWWNGNREALSVKGMQQTGSLVPLTVRGHWNATAQTVDPLT